MVYIVICLSHFLKPGDSSVEEFFDLNAISTDDEYDGAPPAPSPLKICSVDRAKVFWVTYACGYAVTH